MTQSTTPRAPTPAEAVKLLQDAFHTYMACPTVRNHEALLDTIGFGLDALTADASEDAPASIADDAGWSYIMDELCIGPLNRRTLAKWLDARQPIAARPAPVGAGMAVDVMRALTEAHDLAMKQTVQARIPECGDFGAIAQDLSWVIQEIQSAAPAAPVADAGGADWPRGTPHVCGINAEHYGICPACQRVIAEQAKPEAGEQAGAVDDTARLDWLGEHCTGASDSERYLPFRVYWGNKGATQGIRAQIDKARAASATHKGEENG